MEATKTLNVNGLWIISDGLIAKLDPDLFSSKWKAFVEKFEAQESFVAYDAVDMLHRLFGRYRPVLLLVDELSQSHQRQGSDEGAEFCLDP